jgi:hypothetical protein
MVIYSVRVEIWTRVNPAQFIELYSVEHNLEIVAKVSLPFTKHVDAKINELGSGRQVHAALELGSQPGLHPSNPTATRHVKIECPALAIPTGRLMNVK